MHKSRLEWKVGLFVFIGLVLLAALLIQFSKGGAFFRSSYHILLHAPSVGGLKVRAQVLMSGIQVGTVSDLSLAPDGKSVTITLRIYRPYQIHKDARFVFEQSGFLGDQYVAIVPTRNEGDIFQAGDEAQAEAPLDLQEVARTAAGFLQHIDSAATNINDTLNDARRTILSARTLTNLSVTLDNLHQVSERSLIVVDNVNTFVETNRPAIAVTLSNLLYFSEQIHQSATDFRGLLATNSSAIDASISNLQSSSATLKSLLEGVQQGRGLAGKLLVNEQIAANVSLIVSNLSITTSNLNRLGLWGILWQHKPRKPVTPPSERRPLTSPKNPFD